MMKKYLLYILSAITVAIMPSCTDELPLPENYIGDGDAVVSVDIEYEPSAEALGHGSRSSGTALNDINTLSVVIYKQDGSLHKIYNTAELSLKHSINIDKPVDYPTDKPAAEDTTARVTFKFPEPLKFGRYYMYAVVNLGKDVTTEMAEDQETLRSQTVTWQFGDVKKNAQMFGYFTNTDNKTSMGFDAPVLVVNRATTEIHSWVKRLASKVTIAYDGKGLHENVFVYIHKATIKQVPLYCTLGKGNSPHSADSISKDDVDNAQHIMYYAEKGESTTDPGASDADFQKWMMVAKGTDVLGSDHSKKAEALFFYENLQGDYKDHKNKEWFNKVQNPDSVGTNLKPGDPDYKDNVPYGTYIEVDGYYVSNNPDNISSGPIKYRFMLGQNTTYNYDAIRNHHYKLTLCFNGWANQPDWHIVYEEESPEIFVPEVYVPYLYNHSVVYPIKFKGRIKSLKARIIQNDWGPSDDTGEGGVPPATIGAADYDTKVLGFAWNRVVWQNGTVYNQPCPDINKTNDEKVKDPNTNKEIPGPNAPVNYFASNFLYGRHFWGNYQLDEDGNNTSEPYCVTPVWVGFLRLQQPENLEGEDLPATIFANGGSYSNAVTIKGMKNYYEGTGGATIDGVGYYNNTNLGYREFAEKDLTAGSHGSGRNAYTVEQFEIDGELTTTLKMQLWTQPKTMGWISGFSGNNPYESYERRAVIRFEGVFDVTVDGHTEERTVRKDVRVIQSPRLVNPKGVWRSYNTANSTFHVKLMHRGQAASSTFAPLQSIGTWSATVKTGDKSFITLSPGPHSTGSGLHIDGNTGSEIDFTINFTGNIDKDATKCAIVEVLYNGNTCVHNIFVRQGYNKAIPIASYTDDKGTVHNPSWSSYNVFSFDKDIPFGTQTGTVGATMTVNPLAFGTLFKKGNYSEGILISSMTDFGPFEGTYGKTMPLAHGQSKAWGDIYGVARATNKTSAGGVTSSSTTTSEVGGKKYDTKTWHWANFKATVVGETRIYRMPTYDDFMSLNNGQYGVGVLYGDGAAETATTTTDAFGFFDTSNTITSNAKGMRGFFCYNPTTGNQIFFPIGSTGLGRRTMQGLPNDHTWVDWQGELRYSAVNGYLDQDYGPANQFRPIPFNMKNALGSIYWLYMERQTINQWNCFPGWDMNYFDLNFNAYDYAASIGPYGDALPIKPIYVRTESATPIPAMIPGR